MCGRSSIAAACEWFARASSNKKALAIPDASANIHATIATAAVVCMLRLSFLHRWCAGTESASVRQRTQENLVDVARSLIDCAHVKAGRMHRSVEGRAFLVASVNR